MTLLLLTKSQAMYAAAEASTALAISRTAASEEIAHLDHADPLWLLIPGRSPFERLLLPFARPFSLCRC